MAHIRGQKLGRMRQMLSESVTVTLLITGIFEELGSLTRYG